MDAQYKADLRPFLEHLQPHSVLCPGVSCDSVVLGYVAAAPGRLAQHLTELSETPGRFDLADYKTTPDWLNSRSWTHAERWDQDFW